MPDSLVLLVIIYIYKNQKVNKTEATSSTICKTVSVKNKNFA